MEEPEWNEVLRQAGISSRPCRVGKHTAGNHVHLRKVIADLDAAGMTEAAETLCWMVWWQAWHSQLNSALSKQVAEANDDLAALKLADRNPT